jgi:hypothetical protein
MAQSRTAIRVILLTGLLAALGTPGLAADPPATLEGRWVLVEESYGEGSKNLTADDNRVWIEFEGSRAETWLHDPSGSGHEWPAFVDAGGPLPVTPLAVVVDPAAGTAEARYLVSQDPVGGLQLEVVERYALSEDGSALSGNVSVTFVRDGKTEGSFELRRRFERDR